MDVLSRVSSVEADKITPDQDLVANLEIDSPKALRLLLELEQALEIEISDEDAAKLDTVGDILDYVANAG